MHTERRPSLATRRLGRLVVALGFALLSCSTPTPAPPKAAGPMPPPPPPLESRSLSRPDERPRPPGIRLLEQGRYSLNVQNADLAGILVGLGRESSLNVVVEPGVTGTVTADLKQVSLLDVLEQIVLPRGFHYEMKGNVLRVFASDRETRIYRVDYPNYNRRGDTNVTIAGAVASNFNFDVNGSSSESEPQDVSTANAETTQQVDFWDELERTLRGIVVSAGTVGPTPPNAVAADLVVSRQTGLVTVTGSTRVLEEVERYLGRVADSTERQVLIDARILEIKLQDDLDLGVDYEGAPSYKGSTTGVFDRLIIPGYRAATIAQDLAPALATGGWAFGLASEDIGVVLSALALQRDLRVISTPSITTMNNHKALIKVVRNEVYFIAEVESQVVAQVGVTQTTNFVPQVVPIGVTLDVTPQVSDSNRITMHLHPSVSEVVEVTQQPKTDPEQETPGSLPVIDVRETDTVVTVGDGQTLVIGGLMQSRNIKRNKKLPLLGDIPYLGTLFREEKIGEEKTELVILLTPRVLDPPRIARIERDRMDSWKRADDLRRERQEEKPWWRVPYGREYGIEP